MIEKQKQRTIIFYKDYFENFFVQQRSKVQDKIIWTLDLIEELRRIPETYLKNIEDTDGLYEIRVQLGSDIFRIFCFFDEGQLVGYSGDIDPHSGILTPLEVLYQRTDVG